jgi:hypothetical protein
MKKGRGELLIHIDINRDVSGKPVRRWLDVETRQGCIDLSRRHRFNFGWLRRFVQRVAGRRRSRGPIRDRNRLR